MKFIQSSLVILLLTVFTAFAGDAVNGKFSGYMFGDYYWVAANHRSSIQDMNGFWIRRIYFTYDRALKNGFSTRLRFEMSQPGDFTSSAKAAPFVKDAYLKYKTGNTQILMGISPTPTWDLIEHTWGYRSVEKTPLDLQKFGSSRDFGVAIKGRLDKEGKADYHFMLGNGSSNKNEANKGKKVMLAIGLHPTANIIIQAYGDWNDNPGDNDWYTAQAFAAYKSKKARVGVQFAHQVRNVANGTDLNLDIASFFAVLKTSPKTALFGRIDHSFDPNPKGEGISYIPFDKTAESTFIVGGLDLTPIPNVHLMPNLELVVYGQNDAGITPDTDAIPRVTFYYKF